MSQDIVSDALNQIMNAKRVEKKELIIRQSSKFLINLLEIMKKYHHINYKLTEDGLKIEILKLNKCMAIKPRYYVQTDEIEKYLRRFLPSRNFGTMIISTSKGLLTQDEAKEKNIGGSLIAYFY